ncbi:leucine-rich repeat protein [Ruminococcus sp.]|uniref:leucine-rich repeat protein n=1 Tax=Ruminococcus sp. TaxID=41978 RepID=UPI00389002D7
MKKQIKIISVLMSLIMVLSVFTVVPVGVLATETELASSGETSGTTGDCTWRLNGTTLTISGKGSMGNYYSYGSAPWYGAEITDVVIEEGVTSIGSEAFFGCTGLTSVTIPDSVTSIGDGAFHSCTGLTSVTIPDSVTGIGKFAFCDCRGLTSVTIPDSVTEIGNNAFSNCYGLTSVHIIDLAAWCSIDFLRDNPLAYAHHLYLNGELVTELTIPDSVTRIGSDAFYGCTDLTSATIPDSVTEIGECAFYGCTGLTSVTIPDSVTSIGKSSFYGCTGLTNVTIPNSVTSIGKSSFYGCTGLTSVTIPDSVTSIGGYAFGYYYDRASDTTVRISGFTIYGNYGSEAQRYATNSGLKYVILSGEGSTGDCTWRFDGTTLTIAGKGNMGNYSDRSAPWFGAEITEVMIENGVKNVGRYAFANSDKLTSITLPNSVNIIGEGAFSGCVALASVTMSGSVTDIGERAFYDCPSLTSVTIPDSVTNIDTKALGWYRDEAYGLNRKVPNFTIKGYAGSMAETYAQVNGFRFVNLIAKTGDADGDGQITVMDATEVQHLLADLTPHVDESLLMFADVDQNGLLEIIDVTYILRHVAGLEVPYPIG